MVSWDLEAVLVAWSIAEVLQSHLVNHAPYNLFPFGVAFASFPTGNIQEIILLGVQGQGNWIVTEDVVQVLPVGETGCPLNTDLPASLGLCLFLVTIDGQ